MIDTVADVFLDDEVDTLTRRILYGMSGQAFARAANAIYTIALVPLLIRAWGVQGFGEWISLAALISYASYANFGVVTTGGNEVVMAMGADDLRRARLAYQMSQNLTIYVVTPLLIGTGLVANLLPFDQLLNLTQISRQDATTITWLALLQIWLGTFRGMMAAVLYGRGRYARAYAAEGLARLVELTLIVLAVLVFGAHQLTVAAIMCGVAALDLLVVFAMKRREVDWARPDLRIFDLRWIGTQTKPGIGFALSNLTTQSVLLQGPRVALGIVSGGQAVAIYSVYATVLRLVDQIVLLFASPLEVEVAQSYERNELERAYQLITLGTQFAWLAFLTASAVLLITGPWLFHAWTAGRVEFTHGLMLLFILLAGSNQIGRVSAHALIGANRIYEPAALMLPVALGALAFGSALGNAFGAAGMAIGIIAGELAVSLLVVRAMTRWLHRDVSSFARDLLSTSRVPGYARLLVRRLAPSRL
jgi:O-antigen/teichoic acid export membrane protein